MEETPTALAAIRDEFLALGTRDRLLLLLDYANDLPAVPPRFGEHPEQMERVAECQAPVFVTAEADAEGVHVYATAPAEAPTTRGFASVLVHGLTGLSTGEVLSIPDDYPQTLGLGEAVSPLRLRGMGGILARIKRQLRAGESAACA